LEEAVLNKMIKTFVGTITTEQSTGCILRIMINNRNIFVRRGLEK